MEKSIEMKKFKGKAIYEAAGKAAEYSKWACGFYVGCSNNCSYCYCKKGILKGVMGQDNPQLKKCFKDERHAIEIFERELRANLPELQKRGLFFSFTTDPCLPETWLLTCRAINVCRQHDVPFKILTKRTDWLVDEFITELKTNGTIWNREPKQRLWAFGFTLTGHDECEPGASTNAERIEAMKKLHESGFKTWASIEPIIDFKSSLRMIARTNRFCNLYKIGLESGKKYDKSDIMRFINALVKEENLTGILLKKNKFYFKDSLLKKAGINREDLPVNCVTRDYNIFND